MNPENLTEDEVKQAFEFFGMDMRAADLGVLRMISSGGTSDGLSGGVKLEDLSEYMWDHIMGEPEETTVDEVKDTIERLLNRPSVEEVRKAYWALRAVGEHEVADKLRLYGGLTADETDHGDDLAAKWGVRL